MATPSGESRPETQQTALVPDFSWFCCFCCSRRPMPRSSFSLLLTTCSHILCTSCWSSSASPGHCPACQTRTNTLTLSSAWPKQLEPYLKNPVESLAGILKTSQFQEHQKKQSLARRKVAWLFINQERAKQDYDREYRECKEIQLKLNGVKKSLRQTVAVLRSRGIDPLPELCERFGRDLMKELLGGGGASTSNTAPSTPFLTTPQQTRTPGLNTSQQGVEFDEPKKLPHKMRGSVTSLTVRRSPSNPPTPLGQLRPNSTVPGNFQAKQPRMTSTPVLCGNQQPLVGRDQSAGPQPMEIGTSHETATNVGCHNQQSGRPVGHTATPAGVRLNMVPMSSGPPTVQMQPQMVHRSQQQLSIGQYHQPQLHVGRPVPQSAQPIPQSSYPITQSGRPLSQFSRPVQQPVQHILQSGRPIQQPSYPTPQPVLQSAQPIAQFSHPYPQAGQPIHQTGHPTSQFGNLTTSPQQPVQPHPQMGQPTWQMAPQQHTPHQHTSHHHTPTQSHTGRSSRDSVRIRAVPPSSPPRRIFPSPTPSQISHNSHASSGSHTPAPNLPAGSTNSTRITIRPPPSLKHISHSVTQLQSTHPTGHTNSPLGSRARTPTHPSPLLTSYSTNNTPRSPSPWKQGQRSRGSPRKQGHTPIHGSRSGGGRSGGPRLTPVKT